MATRDTEALVLRWLTVGGLLVSFLMTELTIFAENIGGVAVFGMSTGFFGGLLVASPKRATPDAKKERA